MAQLDTSSGGGGKHKKVRGKKMSTTIDMTPMVDLGFLLISFFMLTTSLAKPVAMNLSMPIKEKDDKKKAEIPESKVLNIICDKDNKIWYYPGFVAAGLKTTDYSPEGIRKVILDKQKEVDAKWGKDKKGFTQTICLIKLTEDANYNNMVDVLDEMDITGTKIYAIQDVNKLETEAIANGGNAKVE
ncbi:MAG: biopolymer transporter ExbD [Chitinophagales bacterium]